MISADLEKTGDKSVQLVRGSFLSKYFLQNPYFLCLGIAISSTLVQGQLHLQLSLISMYARLSTNKYKLRNKTDVLGFRD